MHISFYKEWFRHQKLTEGRISQSRSVLISKAYFCFFQNKESRLKLKQSKEKDTVKRRRIFQGGKVDVGQILEIIGSN
jgi:hypothetical protein